jgi:replicative DNA helicase
MDEMKQAAKIEEENKFIKETQHEASLRRAQILRKDMDKTEAVSVESIDNPFSECSGYVKANYARQTKIQRDSFKNGPSFIGWQFDQYFKLIPGTLCTVGAYSGRGKTTIGANVALSFIEQDKKVLIISNEEPVKTYFDRVATAKFGVSYYSFKNGTCSKDENKSVIEFISKVNTSKQMAVLDYEISKGGTTKDAWVLNFLSKVAADVTMGKYSTDVVVIDYLQNIESQFGSQESSYETLKKFCVELKNRANMFPFAIVVLAQMHSDDKRSGNSSDTKFIGGGPIIQNSMIVVEARADIEKQQTRFKMTKLRDGGSGEITMSFRNGKFIELIEALEQDAEDTSNE